LDKKIDNVESNLTKKIDKLDVKIDNVESSLTKKIDSQTFELKQEIRSNATYLDQAFQQINIIDKQRYMDKKNIRYSYV
jgi:chaperonin cofactor prefoldin